MRKSVIRVLCALVSALMLCAALASCDNTQKVLTYKGGYVTMKELSHQLAISEKESNVTYEKGTAEYDEAVISAAATVATMEIYEIEAKKRGIAATDEEVEEEFKTSKRNLEIEYGGFQAFLDDYGITEEFYRKSIRYTLNSQKLTAEFKTGVSVPDDTLLQIYNASIADYRVKVGRDVYVILCEFSGATPSTAEKETLKAKAEGLVSRIKGGESFKAVAKEVAEGKDAVIFSSMYDITEGCIISSLTEDYNLSSYPEENQVFLDLLYKEALTLREGETSGSVFETLQGYCVVYVENIVEETYIKPFEEVKASLREAYITDNYSEELTAFFKGISDSYEFTSVWVGTAQ